jgi:ribosomal protein S18 acetylase RimI-like enzyme
MNNIIKLENLSENKKQIFTNLIYHNFINIAQYEKLKHNKNEIYNLLSNTNNFFFVDIIDKKILGYILGEIIVVDKEKILFITYIFISPNHRKRGLGHKLMNYIEKYASYNDCLKIMLTCDTDDKKIHEWYLKMGFMPDMHFRTYDRFDTLSKNI